MSALVLHFASGGSFISGTVCLLAAVAAIALGRRKLVRSIGRLVFLLALFLIFASATPLPVWTYLVWSAALIGWLGSLHPRFSARPKLRSAGLLVVAGCTLAALGDEISYQLPPRIQGGHFARLVVIGDSLSADDFTEGGDPWPRLLARDHGIEVTNLAFSGAKAGSAAKRAAEEDMDDALVILEIGGNDLLGATSARQFDDDLDRLLQTVCRPTNSVLMLELPLPPLYNQFGAIQRRLARRPGVVLVPKRYFAGVLTGQEATLDHLHLSPEGHRKMEAMIWSLVSDHVRAPE